MYRPIALLAALIPSVASAAIVVQYDSANPQGSGSFPNPTVTVLDLNGDNINDNLLLNPFSTTIPLNNGVGTYTGPSIFGGLAGTVIGDGASSMDTQWDGRSLTAFSWRHQVSLTGNVHSALFFKVDLGAYPLGVALDSTSWMGFSSVADGSVDGLARLENQGQARFLLWDVNGNFYVSQSLITDTANGRVLDGAELAVENWALWTVPTNIDSTYLNFDAGTASFNISTAQINAAGIAGIGFITDKDNYSAVRHWLEFSKFYVDAEPAVPVVPEPTSLALLACGGMMLAVRRRR